MKKLSSILMLAMMCMVALSFTACGGDDDDNGGNGGGSYDDTEYCQVSINGEDCTTNFNGGGYLATLVEREINGKTCYPYGGMTEQIKLNQQDAIQLLIAVGYVSEDMKTIFPHAKGTYEVISSRGEYFVDDYPDNIGMVITGGNMKYRTVTSGSLKITKVDKYKNNATNKAITGRDDIYVSEGTFDFILTDDGDGEENHITGKFRVVN